jgi:hypothetical protein
MEHRAGNNRLDGTSCRLDLTARGWHPHDEASRANVT